MVSDWGVPYEGWPSIYAMELLACVAWIKRNNEGTDWGYEFFIFKNTYIRHSQQEEVSEYSSYLFPWMSSQWSSKISSVSTGILSFSEQERLGPSSKVLNSKWDIECSL